MAAIVLSGIAAAQIPDPPPDPVATPKQDKRILGVVPNYATVDDPPAQYTPMSTREKFRLAAQDAFDPFSWVLTGIYAGVAQWSDSYPGFGQGTQGYAKRYGASFADGAISNYMSEAVIPTLLHEDPRYFRMGQGSAWKRIGYAITRVAVTRADSGGWRFNTSEVVGTAAAASIANLYYPASNRNVPDTLGKFALNIASDAGFNVLKEFWPDVRRKVLHKTE